MATEVLDRSSADLSTSYRTLLLVWQDPASRRFIKVGQLDALSDSRFAFQYLDAARGEESFAPLADYPNLDAVYVSDEVPAFFANRVLSSDRPAYDNYLSWLGIADLSPDQIPVEVLARTGGGRATDTFHVVDLPIDDGQRFSSRFFVSGIRYAPDSDAELRSLQPGAELNVQLEAENPRNSRAVVVAAESGAKLGYVPDWLCGDIHDRIQNGWSVRVVAERINPDAPAHIRLLVRLDASPTAPKG